MSVGEDKSKVLLANCTWDGPFLCQSKELAVVDEYRYLGLPISASSTLLQEIATTQLRHFHVAASTLWEAAS